MKRLLFFFAVLLITAVSTSAQTIVKGDMNGDGQVTVADVTSVVNTAVGKTPMETINVGTSGNPYMVDNSQVVGTWHAADGSTLTFNANGTTDYPGGATYKYRPIQGVLTVFDAFDNPLKALVLNEATSQYLLNVDYATGVFTYYTNSSSMVSSLVLSQSTLTMNSGASQQLTVTVMPDNAYNPNLAWTTSDASVATVDSNGLVTAVAGGTCTITCTALDGSGVSSSCEVTVTQLVSSITLSRTTLTLEIDNYQKITATVLPTSASNKKLTWTSSDESVAEVTSTGGVAAVGYGTCTVTATAQDGSGVSASCEVTVVQ